MRWHQIGQVGEADVGFTRGLKFIDREAVQPRGQTIQRGYEDTEQVYYILENCGILEAEGSQYEIQEGDMVHLPAGTQYAIRNPHAQWLSYMIIAA